MYLCEANELLVPQKNKIKILLVLWKKKVQQFQHSLLNHQIEIAQVYSFLRYFRMQDFSSSLLVKVHLI